MSLLTKKAPISAFFCGYLLLSNSLFADQTSFCPDSGEAKEYIVHHITDGDTFTLTNGEKVRILGINTPEINYKNQKQSQALAIKARNALQQLLPDGSKVKLIFDQRQKDRYKRLLAFVRVSTHADTEIDVGELLLAKGLAWQYLILPNQLCWKRYREAENVAYNGLIGVWNSENYSVRFAKNADITDKKSSYKRLTGVITATEHSRKNFWFVVDDRIWFGISRKDEVNFSNEISSLKIGSKIQISGWMYRSYGKLRLKIRHPQALRHFDNAD